MARGNKRSRGSAAAGGAVSAGARRDVIVPLSSDGGRRKRVPPIKVMAPLSGAEALLEMLAPTMTEDPYGNKEYRYSQAKLGAVFAAMDIEHAEVTYSGGNDEGSLDSMTVHYRDGRDESWKVEWPKPESDVEGLKWHLIDALWQPALDEWGAFSGEFTVQGSVSWAPSEGLEHTFEAAENPDRCEGCEGEYEAGTVTFHEVAGADGYTTLVCPSCYERVKEGDPEMDYSLVNGEAIGD